MIPAQEKLSDYLLAQIARRVFPGAQYVAGEDGKVALEGAFGFATLEPDTIETTLDTIYDLASLTKPLVTALLATIFVERGLLDFNAPVSVYLSEFCDISEKSEAHKMTIKHLITHTSGLPAWRPLYVEAKSRDEVSAFITLIAMGASPESAQVVYSDLNYILLGFILERIGGQRIDQIAQREIFDPLALRRTMFNPPLQFQSEIAATERGREHERRVIEKEFDKSKINSSILASSSFPLRGEVHDGNARFLGAVAGHAGLFSTAREVFQITNQFLPGSLLLNPESLELFTHNLTTGRGDARSIGWMLAETPNSSAGPLLPPTAFGHTGFTGTSVWADPIRRRVMVLLTNRIHPNVTDVDMKEARQRFNSLAIEAMNVE